MAKKEKESILVKAANETNMVMAYGMDEKGKVVDPDEQIDVTLKEKALEKELESRLNEDLRMEDKEDFSEDVWQLFQDKGWGPFASKAEEAEEEEDEDAEEPEGEDAEAPEEEEEDDEEEEAPKPAKKAAKKSKEEKPAKKAAKKSKDEDEEEAPKKSKRDDGTKKPRAPREKGPSFEQIAMDIVKSTDPKDARDALIEKFTGLYHERGKTDENFIRMRVDIYYKIACTRLHVEMVGVPAKKSKKDEKPSKKKDEEAPKKSKRG